MTNNPSRWIARFFYGLLLSGVGLCGAAAMGDRSGPAVLAAESSSSPSFFDDFFRVYTPRRQCMYNEAPVVWLHLISDLLIGLAYYSIPLALAYFVSKREDLAFHWIFWMFAAFILACGTTHFFGVLDLWVPMYKLDGVFRLGTALISVVTAVLLWPLIPKALALPSPAQLEKQVRERTAELANTNQMLRTEIEGRKRAEAERERLLESERTLRNEAERANRSKDDFLAILSHELRTPLNAILGWAQLLTRDASNADDVKHGLAVIERNTRAQVSMIEDLLDMSRIIAGKMRLEMRNVDLQVVIHDALQAVEPAAAAREITVEREIGTDAAGVRGDAARLQQVMWNLLSNAVKFTPHGGRVRVSARRVNGQIEVAVADNGAGIDPSLLPHLFQRFQQADSSSSRRFGGLGLGLAIVRHIVELHGGTVEAHSEGLGRGSAFFVRIPAKLLKPEPLQGERKPKAEANGKTPLRGARILVLEDEEDSRLILRRVLEPAGATVFETSSVREALSVLTTQRVDLILCDIGMPDEDGYNFIKTLRARSPEQGGTTPVVAVTAFARSEDYEQTMRAGFRHHVTKPFEANELLGVIRETLESTSDMGAALS